MKHVRRELEMHTKYNKDTSREDDVTGRMKGLRITELK
jgi:hypothetical protein